MPETPQSYRTFFISTATWERRSILQSHPLCNLLLSVLRENRAKNRFQLHEFVFMRDHIHLILTPNAEVSLEKTMQFIKGGFSFRAKKDNLFNGEIWQKGFHEDTIKSPREFAQQVEYIWMNPVKAGMADRPEDYLYSSARLRSEVDPAPRQFQLSTAAEAGSSGARFSAGLKSSSPC